MLGEWFCDPSCGSKVELLIGVYNNRNYTLDSILSLLAYTNCVEYALSFRLNIEVSSKGFSKLSE